MLSVYEKLTNSLIEAIKKSDDTLVSNLLDERGSLIDSMCADELESFKKAYKESKVYKKDLDIEFMLLERKNSLLKEIDDFNNFKEGNMLYINTLKDNENIFVARV